ncbi:MULTISPECIES: hypothetical protein [unclassified Kitasatospora]|uniref:hypothetical protein n=1 Tax=unclassified Kitasatospora TaxID=2633591 RepID=UPI00070AD90F|nr:MULTISPECIES: hypothetical protein [unclassified Kitasatospora]KQV20824.1 hypothetical protein ASC99_20150 [Kitasatospora sp. Root107]KRB60519.1 hypothetical protein ASE03_13025 [Kitasatospora sp. Root187]
MDGHPAYLDLDPAAREEYFRRLRRLVTRMHTEERRLGELVLDLIGPRAAGTDDDLQQFAFAIGFSPYDLADYARAAARDRELTAAVRPDRPLRREGPRGTDGRGG